MAALSKVISGSPMVIPATTYNAFVDAARAHVARQHFQLVQPTSQHTSGDTILLRNDSGSTRDRFEVLGIDGPVIAPVENEDEFLQQVVLCGVTPTTDYAQRFAVVSEPILSGAIGRAWISGVCPARVMMNDESDVFAQAVAGSSLPQSCSSGAAQLLWIEPVADRSVSNIAWTIIRFGGGGGTITETDTDFAIIESHIGTSAPYIYSGRQITYQGSGRFGTPYGVDISIMYCISEIGPSGAGVAPLADGDIVRFWSTDNGYLCSERRYRGIYH